jgi:hypothetical protein
VKVAYILPVHRGAAQVVRLLHRLATDDTVFVLHVDARAGSTLEQEIVQGAADLASVSFVEPHRCYWGGFGMARAALKCIRRLVVDDVEFDYAVLVSGQDYPLRTAPELAQFYAAAEGRSFMHYLPLPAPDRWGPRGGLERVQDWHFIRRRALHLRLPRPRRIPGGLAPYAGESWWSFPREVVEYVDRYVLERPELPRFFEHVLHATEVFFQTIVMNSPHAGSVVNDDLRYIRWEHGLPNPATLTTADVDELFASGNLFARKFDVAVDARVLDLIDARLEPSVARANG